MRLADWVQPQHLEPEAHAGYRRQFTSVPHASVAIDGFLQPRKLAALQRVFSIEGSFEERYFLDGRVDKNHHATERTVSAEAWYAAPEHHRGSCERVFVTALPQHRIGEGIVTQVKFLELMGSPEFMSFLEGVSGIRPSMLSGQMIRIMAGGHYIRPHTDFGPRRELCGIFYVSPGWHPSFGGRFRHRGPGPDIVPIEPRLNRLLVFHPRADCTHDVEATTDAARDWQRWAYTLWFGSPD
jgi:hypothetical protein